MVMVTGFGGQRPKPGELVPANFHRGARLAVDGDVEVGERDDLRRKREKHFTRAGRAGIEGLELGLEMRRVDRFGIGGPYAQCRLESHGGRKAFHRRQRPWFGVISRPAARGTGGWAAVDAVATAASMLLETARLLAADKAGSSKAASTEMMTITTSSSMSVNALRSFSGSGAGRLERTGLHDFLRDFVDGWFIGEGVFGTILLLCPRRATKLSPLCYNCIGDQ